jgi:hypothetical protein
MSLADFWLPFVVGTAVMLAFFGALFGVSAWLDRRDRKKALKDD